MGRFMALIGHGAMSELSPLCAPKRTSSGKICRSTIEMFPSCWLFYAIVKNFWSNCWDCSWVAGWLGGDARSALNSASAGFDSTSPWCRLHDDEQQRHDRHDAGDRSDASGNAEQRGSPVQVTRVPSRFVNSLGGSRAGRDGGWGAT